MAWKLLHVGRTSRQSSPPDMDVCSRRFRMRTRCMQAFVHARTGHDVQREISGNRKKNVLRCALFRAFCRQGAGPARRANRRLHLCMHAPRTILPCSVTPDNVLNRNRQPVRRRSTQSPHHMCETPSAAPHVPWYGLQTTRQSCRANGMSCALSCVVQSHSDS